MTSASMLTLDHPGPTESFTELLKKVQPRLERILGHYGIPPEDAEDVLQDTFLTLLYKWRQVENPEAWLLGTARKKCIMYWRSRRSKIVQGVDSALLDLLSRPEAPVQDRRDLLADLDRLLDELPDRCRTVIRLRYGIGLSPAEVAEEMGYRASSVRKVASRCLAALTERLCALEPEKDQES